MSIRRLSELALAATLVLAASSARAAPPADPQDDGMAAYRDRFKLGMERYKQGAPAQAIAYWEPIYRELGDREGYRLAYDLGIAYAELGDAEHEAERLQSFVDEVDTRRSHGESLGSMVTKEEVDARARLADLVGTMGRIAVSRGASSAQVRLDARAPRPAGFIAWVAPGEHVVTWAPDTADAQTKTVGVAAGALVEVSFVAPPPAAPAPAPAAIRATPPPAPHPLFLPLSGHPSRSRPFSPALIAATGAIAFAAGIVAVPLEVHANTLYDRFTAAQTQSGTGTIPSGDRESFAAARTWAYVTIGGGAAFGVATAVLATWYLVGTPGGDAAVAVVARRGGGSLSMDMRF